MTFKQILNNVKYSTLNSGFVRLVLLIIVIFLNNHHLYFRMGTSGTTLVYTVYNSHANKLKHLKVMLVILILKHWFMKVIKNIKNDMYL